MNTTNETLNKYVYAVLDSYEINMVDAYETETTLDSFYKEQKVKKQAINKLAFILDRVDYNDSESAMQVHKITMQVYDIIKEWQYIGPQRRVFFSACQDLSHIVGQNPGFIYTSQN